MRNHWYALNKYTDVELQDSAKAGYYLRLQNPIKRHFSKLRERYNGRVRWNKNSLFHSSAFTEVGKVKYTFFQLPYKYYIFTTIKTATVTLCTHTILNKYILLYAKK